MMDDNHVLLSCDDLPLLSLSDVVRDPNIFDHDHEHEHVETKVFDYLCNKNFLDLIQLGGFIEDPLTREQINTPWYSYFDGIYHWDDLLCIYFRENKVELQVDFISRIQNSKDDIIPLHTMMGLQRINNANYE